MWLDNVLTKKNAGDNRKAILPDSKCITRGFEIGSANGLH